MECLTVAHLVVLVLVLIFVKANVSLVEVLLRLVAVLELESLAGEPIDGTGDDLLLELLAELVVDLEAVVELLKLVLVDVLVLEGLWRRRLGRAEEVEERVDVDGLADDTSAAGGYCQCVCGSEAIRRTLVALLLDLDLLCQVLVLLPLDLSANGSVVDKVSTVADLFLFHQPYPCLEKSKLTW